MAASQNFVATPKSPVTRGSTANTNRDGTGTLVDLYTAGAGGGRVDDITIKASSTTTAGMIRFYRNDVTNSRLIKEVSVGAITPSGTVQSFEAVLTDLAWVLANGHKIQWSTNNAEQFDVTMSRGGDF